MSNTPKLVDSKQIKSTSLCVLRPFPLRFYFWPFICLYSIWASLWYYLTRINPEILKSLLEASISSNPNYPFLTLGFWFQYEEFMLIPLGLLATAHFVTIMGCSWNIHFKALITCRIVKSIEEAQFILVTPQEHCGKAELCQIEKESDVNTIFSYQQRKFYWNSDKKMFEKPCYPDNLNFSHYSKAKGLNSKESEEVFNRFGKNEFDLPVPTFMSLFKEHIKAPFFVFQIFCVGLWCLDEYWYYSVFTLFMLVFFESTVVQQRLKTLQEFRGMSVPPIDAFVLRNSKWIQIKSNEILPGDVCALPFTDKVDSDGLTMPCDFVLLQGSCIVNEAMISGESTPLLKESIEDVDGEELIDMSDSHRNHVLFGGTKVLQIHTTSSSSSSATSYPVIAGLNCPVIIGYAGRTGFGTLQGKLVRTMIYSSEQVSANNAEAFLFIGFLLFFAIIAAGYVLVKGVEEEGRSRYKLLIECTLIITAVVPTELPMELSMAVNNSLQELSKFAIFCMEPFRIPLAGKIDICCFDKTGTITAENLIVEGLAGLDNENPAKIITESFGTFGETATLAQKVMGICNSLFLVKEDQIAGDPMEKATLEFLNWRLSASDEVTGNNKQQSYKIVHRFPFSSALKRMSVIAKDLITSKMFIGVKGAPEILQSRFVKVPSWYESTYKTLAQSGARVIALGYRDLPSSSITKSFKQAQRDEFETDLIFCGFIVFRCPLKKDSCSAIRLLKGSSHRVIMITGDNSLTAIHTAKEVDIISKDSSVLLFDLEEDDESRLKVIDYQSGKDCDWLNDLDKISGSDALSLMKKMQVSLCFTGNAYDLLSKMNPNLSISLLPQTAIFARTSPTQKESILAKLKSPPLSLNTLMCGDGTNDVGALKQAHIGVALLDGRPEDLQKILKEMRDSQVRKHQKSLIETRKKWESSLNVDSNSTAALDKMLKTLEDADAEGNNLVKLGDASVAAPFTSKISTIQSVCTLIRLGRLTLVTTIQMYKILALNSLIYAYNLSVLNLSGVRYGDFQMTVSGMLISSCFLFLTRGQVLKEMSPQRPQSNIFNLYLLSSVLLQFALHVGVLIYVTQSALKFEIPWKVTEKLKFQPGLMNTAIYLIGIIMQVSTFVVNYQGRPFRESLIENKPLRNSLAAVGAICIIAAFEIYPEFNEWLELVPMPPTFKTKLISALAIDLFGCYLIEWTAKKLFFSNQSKLEMIL